MKLAELLREAAELIGHTHQNYEMEIVQQLWKAARHVDIGECRVTHSLHRPRRPCPAQSSWRGYWYCLQHEVEFYDSNEPSTCPVAAAVTLED